MIDRIIAIYCLCDSFFKERGVVEWHNIKMPDAEVMTVFIVASLEFYGNVEKARKRESAPHSKANGKLKKAPPRTGLARSRWSQGNDQDDIQ